MKKTFVLSIDGGGAKALISTYILREIEKIIGRDLPKFDLYAGTSAGSIIAASLAVGQSVSYVVNKFESLGAEIFPRHKNWGIKKFFVSPYCNKQLIKYLAQEFNSITMQGVFEKYRTKLLIPVVQIQELQGSIVKTPHDSRFTRDANIKLADAVISSCSAPMFFDPYFFRIQGNLSDHRSWLATDGSLFMTNPSLASVLELVSYNNIHDVRENYTNIGDIFVLSIGNIRYSPMYKESNFWGLLTGWKHKQLIDSIMELQKRSAADMTRLMLPKGNYVRLEYHGDSIDLDCDSKKHQADFKNWAEQIVTDNEKQIKAFFNVMGENHENE